MKQLPHAVEWKDNTLVLLDQRKLPHIEEFVTCINIVQAFDCIQTLAVRGAPAIGIAAAYGLLLGLEKFTGSNIWTELECRCDYLIDARPTAINLAWAINRMRARGKQCSNEDDLFSVLLEEARSIYEEDKVACNAIGETGLPLVEMYPNLLTHCNAGSLAVSELGTALAPIYRARQKGIKVHVYVDETRPLLQGSRLTAYELQRNEVDCTLISDNMAAHIMSEGKVDAVIVGADRIASNGDTANKIGTMNLAILCNYFSIPFYVAAPLSTLDAETSSGDVIKIEERDASEVREYAGKRIAPNGVAARSPAFDVTPSRLITGIITDAGILEPPYTQSIARVIEP